jgi:DNA-binding SARP family transcriptional activator
VVTPDRSPNVQSGAVEIAVLGPLEVRGGEHRFRRSAAVELIVYLAFHRRGVRNSQWPLAIWPDRAVAQATVHSTVSDARRALGRGADGSDHLSRGPQLHLGSGVTTDVDRFAALASSDDPRVLSRALGLVRGPLFAGLRHSDWAVVEGTQAALESMIVETALRAVEGHLGHRRLHDAERAARAALTGCPYDERLYRLLLQVTAAMGSRVGLRRTMAELVTRAAGWPAGPRCPGPECRHASCPGLLDPQTVTLYRELSEQEPAAEGPGARL